MTNPLAKTVVILLIHLGNQFSFKNYEYEFTISMYACVGHLEIC